MAHQPSNDQDARENAKLRFALELRRVKREACEPSFRELQSRSDGRLTPTTISRVLSGKAQAASWYFTTNYLHACGISDQEIHEVWRPKWVQMMNTLRPLDPELDTDPLSSSPLSETCSDCGLIVGDPEVHQAWHQDKAKPTRQPAPRPTAETADGDLADHRVAS